MHVKVDGIPTRDVLGFTTRELSPAEVKDLVAFALHVKLVNAATLARHTNKPSHLLDFISKYRA